MFSWSLIVIGTVACLLPGKLKPGGCGGSWPCLVQQLEERWLPRNSLCFHSMAGEEWHRVSRGLGTTESQLDQVILRGTPIQIGNLVGDWGLKSGSNHWMNLELSGNSQADTWKRYHLLPEIVRWETPQWLGISKEPTGVPAGSGFYHVSPRDTVNDYSSTVQVKHFVPSL